METMYQRSMIQEESLYYETLKHNGEFPIIGVNTFLSSKGSPTSYSWGGYKSHRGGEKTPDQSNLVESLHKSTRKEYLQSIIKTELQDTGH